MIEGELAIEKSISSFPEERYFSGSYLIQAIDFKATIKDKKFPLGIVTPNEMVGEEYVFHKETTYGYSTKVASLEAEIFAIRVEYFKAHEKELFAAAEEYFDVKPDSRNERFFKSVLTFFKNSLFLGKSINMSRREGLSSSRKIALNKSLGIMTFEFKQPDFKIKYFGKGLEISSWDAKEKTKDSEHESSKKFSPEKSSFGKASPRSKNLSKTFYLTLKNEIQNSKSLRGTQKSGFLLVKQLAIN